MPREREFMVALKVVLNISPEFHGLARGYLYFLVHF